MGNGYRDQVWFDLNTKQVVHVAERTLWDIGYDCDESAFNIYLNTALSMSAALAESSDWAAVTSDAGLAYRTDHSSGFSDSLVIGNALDQDGKIWIIDMGVSLSGSPRGKRKVRFELTESNNLAITHAALDGSDEQTVTVNKVAGYNRMGFSFNEPEDVVIEPLRTDYDLVFTRYSNIFYTTYPPYYLPYSVTGVLVNPYETDAATVLGSSKDFFELTIDDAMEATYVDSADVIGYDWKSYSLEDRRWTIYPEDHYVIRDQEGFYYKLRFIDFDNPQEGTSYMVMEVQQL